MTWGEIRQQCPIAWSIFEGVGSTGNDSLAEDSATVIVLSPAAKIASEPFDSEIFYEETETRFAQISLEFLEIGEFWGKGIP